MKKKTNLESGFLFLYDWMPLLDRLPAKELKALLVALIALQREEIPLPTFKNPLTDSFARMIEPVIRRRLEGALYARRAMTPSPTPEGEPAGEPVGEPPQQEERRYPEDEKSAARAEPSGAEAPQGLPAARRALSEQEREVLLGEGVPADYLREREERAMGFALKSGRSAVSLLREWWQRDRPVSVPYRPEREEKPSSFDAEDFFAAALAKSDRATATR